MKTLRLSLINILVKPCCSSVNMVCLSLLLFLLSTSAIAVPGQTSNLKEIRTRIKNIESTIKDARNKTTTLQKELQKNEKASAEIVMRLNQFERAISKKQTELKSLKQDRTKHQSTLATEKEKLKHQIRSAYKMGRNDYIRLILNQQDPSKVGRILAYHNYHNQLRSGRITQVQKTLNNLTKIETSILEQKDKLALLKQKHQNKLQKHNQYLKTRRDIIAKLERDIKSKDATLQILQRNERELSKLFQNLEEKETPFTNDKNLSSFRSQKGKLHWPTKGRLLKKFGHLRKKGNLKWQGVLIGAKTGSNVKAISDGKVVFADWFRNMGLLIIIDHGDGYMSLYAHNQSLLKNNGEQILAGEKIATVGDSGGQNHAALYFEIRKEGKPLNPVRWCKT